MATTGGPWCRRMGGYILISPHSPWILMSPCPGCTTTTTPRPPGSPMGMLHSSRPSDPGNPVSEHAPPPPPRRLGGPRWARPPVQPSQQQVLGGGLTVGVAGGGDLVTAEQRYWSHWSLRRRGRGVAEDRPRRGWSLVRPLSTYHSQIPRNKFSHKLPD